MIALVLAAVMAAAADKPALVSVHAVAADGRAAVEVVTSAVATRVALDRTPDEVVLTLDARLPKDLGALATVPPLRSLAVKPTATGVAVHIGVDAGVGHEVRRQGTLLTVLFGPAGAVAIPAAAPPPGSADVRDLYRGLLPASTAEPPPTPSAPAGDALDPGLNAPEAEGLHLGLLTLRPSISGVWADAENALLSSPEPLADQYYELRPQLAAEMPLGTGRFLGDYEARIRRGSRFAIVDEETTHLANANLELPLGPNVLSRLGGHFSRGLLETTEVDPGREYFYQLGRFTRYDGSGGLRLETGSRFDVDLAGTYYSVEVDDQSGFFDYRGWTGTAGLGMELGPRVRAVLGYTYEEIPPDTERVEARMRAHTGTVSLHGEILPLVTGHLNLGYRDQRNPDAGPGGTHYQGLSASAQLVKEFTRSTNLVLTASRATPPSAFESNGFFVATLLRGELNFGLPASFVALLGAGYHHNEYRVVSPEIGAPREDRLTSWMAGLGRPITDWVLVRADYRYEQRASNLDQFDTDGHAFTVQFGVRLYRPRGRR
jgi:hypothetical protein